MANVLAIEHHASEEHVPVRVAVLNGGQLRFAGAILENEQPAFFVDAAAAVARNAALVHQCDGSTGGEVRTHSVSSVAVNGEWAIGEIITMLSSVSRTPPSSSCIC